MADELVESAFSAEALPEAEGEAEAPAPAAPALDEPDEPAGEAAAPPPAEGDAAPAEAPEEPEAAPPAAAESPDSAEQSEPPSPTVTAAEYFTAPEPSLTWTVMDWPAGTSVTFQVSELASVAGQVLKALPLGLPPSMTET